MNHRTLSDNEFDQLWQETEARGHGRRLAEGYPQWQRNRRRTTGLVAMMVVAVAVAVPLLTSSLADSSHEHVYCNRSGIAAEQWVALAGDLLMEQ